MRTVLKRSMIHTHQKRYIVFGKVLTVIWLLCSILPASGQQKNLPRVSKLDEPSWLANDEIYQLLSSDDTTMVVNKESQALAILEFQDGYKIFKDYRETKNMELVLQSKPFFERALKHNTFDQNIRRALNTVYSLLFPYYQRIKNLDQGILIGERLLKLSEENKMNHLIYFGLASLYDQWGKPKIALFNSQLAELYLPARLQQAITSQETTRVNRLKVQMLQILRFQYNIHLAHDRTNEAIHAAQKALEFADKKQKEVFENLIRSANRNSFWNKKEARDLERSIARLQREGKKEETVDKFELLVKMFPDISDQRRIEAERLYAAFQFQSLEQKVPAIERLLPWVSGQDTLATVVNIQDLYDDFSLMCLSYGIEILEKDRLSAYCYFLQGLSANGGSREKIMIRLIALSQSNNSEVIRLGRELWDQRSKLDDVEVRWLCEQLVYAYKKAGNGGECQRFLTEYRKLL